jgi:hypothetical protein
VTTSNPDIQAQAFVDKKNLFLALNNLDEEPQSLQLKVDDLGTGIRKVLVKSLTVPKGASPTYSEKELPQSPSEMQLGFGETVVLEYELTKPIELKKKLKTTRYYSENQVQPIVTGEKMQYEYNNESLANNVASASLSLSIGRNPEHSKRPSVKVNGSSVDVPTNWKGYDQKGRKTFFGAIEIPVPEKLIKAENTVSISFPDSGGHVSSVVLNVTQLKDGTSGIGDNGTFHKWTSNDGVEIEARFLGLKGQSVKLLMKNGRSYVVPFARLSAKSVATAKQMAGQR